MTLKWPRSIVLPRTGKSLIFFLSRQLLITSRKFNMETIETWARIAFNSAWYEVSTLGRVCTVAKVPRSVAVKHNALGAPTVRISYVGADGKTAVSFLSLPKLVATTFPELVPNPNNLPLLKYVDGNEMNCAVTNLYWSDYARSTKEVPVKPKKGRPPTEKEAKALQTKAQKRAEAIAAQQQWWNSMTYAEQQNMLKLGQPEEGVVLVRKTALLKEIAEQQNMLSVNFDCTTKDLGDLYIPRLVSFVPNEEFVKSGPTTDDVDTDGSVS